MGFFIIKEGVERKAEPEDILSLINDRGIHCIFREIISAADIDLPFALAHIADDIKDKVYRNMVTRIRNRTEKKVKAVESTYKKDARYLKYSREKLITYIGENEIGWLYDNPERIVWKEEVYEKETPKKESSDPIEKLINDIEKACVSGDFCLTFDHDKISKDELQKIFAAFQGRKSELQKIQKLDISADDIPVAAPLFEAGGIKELRIHGEFAETWPDFLENCRDLTSIEIYAYKGVSEFPLWLRNAVSLRRLIIEAFIPIPDWIGDLQSLTELTINDNTMETLPDSIGNLKELAKLTIRYSHLEKLPDSIGNLYSLKELELDNNEKLASLPDSMGNLKNLSVLRLSSSSIISLPDWIGDLENLTKLFLPDNEILTSLPDSIGKLKNLKTLDISDTPIEKLPDSITNCTSLENVDIRHTCINSFPDFLSSIKGLKKTKTLLPIDHINSGSSFYNAYCNLAENIIRLATKAIAQGLLSLEEELYDIADIFFREGLNLLVNGAGDEAIQRVLTIKIEREQNHYRKKLMRIAMEGILCIQRGKSIPYICIKLGSMVNIINNPLDTAFAKYLSGDCEAFDNIDFESGMQPEGEREESRFIKRAFQIMKIYKNEGLLGLEKRLDNDSIMARDIFEYGLFLMVEYWDYKDIDKVLTMLTTDDTDPVRKNFSLAKKDAVRMIYEGETASTFESTLLAYFDDEVNREWFYKLYE